MNYTEWMNFECAVMDRIETEDIKDAQELENFADEFHLHIEAAFREWAMDNNMEYDGLY